MPTYDYACDACGHAEEIFQTFKEEALTKCPKCNKARFKRLIGAGAGFLFKGSGFYQTDYRSESYKSDAKKDAPAEKCTDNPKACDGPCATPKDA